MLRDRDDDAARRAADGIGRGHTKALPPRPLRAHEQKHADRQSQWKEIGTHDDPGARRETTNQGRTAAGAGHRRHDNHPERHLLDTSLIGFIAGYKDDRTERHEHAREHAYTRAEPRADHRGRRNEHCWKQRKDEERGARTSDSHQWRHRD